MKPRVVPEYSPAFEAFWSCYPRRVAKLAAWREWTLWGCEVFPDAVMAGLRSQLPVFARRQVEHIPHAGTWLYQRRWEDVVAPPMPKVAMLPAASVGSYRPARCTIHEGNPRARREGILPDFCSDCREQKAREAAREDEPESLADMMPAWAGKS
jgi:hypothetical protein